MQPGDSRLKLFYLMEILLQRTDEDHPLNASELKKILEKEYEITVNRTTIYSDIQKMKDADFDIICREGKDSGYYVASREFELAELKLLVDAVQSSNFVTQKKSADLIKKLESLCSRHEAKQLESQVTIFNRSKTPNERIYYNIDKIHSAIFHNRQITYQYVQWTMDKKQVARHDGEYYIVSPLRLIWDDENYYLIGFDEKSRVVKHYRVDKMSNTVIQEDARSEEALEEKIDAAAFSKKTFGMFSGNDIKVEFQGRKNVAGVMLDRFGTDVWMHPIDEYTFSARVMVTVSPQFFGWVTAIGKDLQITGPENVKQAYREYIQDIMKGWEEWDLENAAES